MRSSVLVALVVSVVGAACGDDETTLDDFLPTLPTPDGTAQSVFAGQITTPDELAPGPASAGLVGDYFMRNSRVRFVIQNEMRSIGVSPWGGNVVDAVKLGRADDGLGEISMNYKAGRTCAHDTVEVLLDGAGGGPAVVRARGRADVNDFINLKATGLLPIDDALNPDIDDGVECATTYVLWPDRERLEISWTLFNPDPTAVVSAPFGMVNDTGGENTVFYPRVGMNHVRAGFEALFTGGAQPIEYAVYQGPTVAYGVLPRHDGPNAAAIIAGVSAVVFGVDEFLQIIDSDLDFLRIEPKTGVTNVAELAVGDDAADIEASFLRMKEGTPALGTLAGTATFVPSGVAAAGARAGVFIDADGDGALGDDDPVSTYLDADLDGAFSGEIPAGSYLVRADVKNLARSAVVAVTVPLGGAAPELAFDLPEPARVEYRVVDDATGEPIPAKIVVLGRSPVAADARLHESYERRPGVLRTLYAPHGSDLVDEPLWLPPGGPYRILVSRGPEWSVATQLIPDLNGPDSFEFRLRRVVDTTGYVASEFHQHSMGSPDSMVTFDDRLASLVAEGIEFFASTDHDYLVDYAPLIEAAELQGVIQSAVGVEATPFVYGHFQAYPLIPDDEDPTHGAVDWARGTAGFAMLPSELWQAYREQRGARIIQVNHPRSLSATSAFQAYFDRAGLVFDFDARGFYGSPDEMAIPSDWLRLPEDQDVFSPNFDALEIWNGFGTADSDGDGVREIQSLDLVMRDWMNFLSLGKLVAPLGNSDSHSYERDAAGMPRSLIRVSDDGPGGLSGALGDEVWDRMLGNTQQDIVVSNGPMIRASAGGGGSSAIGATLTPAGDGTVTLAIEVTSAEWVQVDTVEIFANEVFGPVVGGATFLVPLVCFTSRDPATLAPTDPCLDAPVGGAQPLVVTLETSGPGGIRSWRAEATLTLSADDVALHRDQRAQGEDAWIVVRARGQRPVYPVLLDNVIATDLSNLDVLVSGTPDEVEEALVGRGVPATAFTAPILVDFDGGGYLAPFAP